jgi:hypothetical protein
VSLLGRVAAAWRTIEDLHDAVLVEPWRRGLRREARRQEQELLAVLLLEALGAQSPVSYYALEAYPWLAARAHELHRARGIDRLDSGACC